MQFLFHDLSMRYPYVLLSSGIDIHISTVCKNKTAGGCGNGIVRCYDSRKEERGSYDPERIGGHY